MIEKEPNQISDIDKAFTAARAEKVVREKMIPKAKEGLEKTQGGTGDDKVYNALAQKAGEERIKNYDPEEEKDLEGLREMATRAIQEINQFLVFHDLEGSNKNKRVFFDALLSAKKYLQEEIDQIDLGIQPVVKSDEGRMMHPKNTIPSTIRAIEAAIKAITS